MPTAGLTKSELYLWGFSLCGHRGGRGRSPLFLECWLECIPRLVVRQCSPAEEVPDPGHRCGHTFSFSSCSLLAEQVAGDGGVQEEWHSHLGYADLPNWRAYCCGGGMYGGDLMGRGEGMGGEVDNSSSCPSMYWSSWPTGLNVLLLSDAAIYNHSTHMHTVKS